MDLRRGKLSKVRLIMRIAVLLLCAVVVALVPIYIFKPDLLARAGRQVEDPEIEEQKLDGILKPENKSPELDANPQLDAPDPEEAPVIPPGEPLPAEHLQKVNGDSLFALVTKQTTLGRYAPGDLEVIPAEIVHPDRRGNKYYLRREPLEHLKKMWAAAGEGGVRLTVTSAYRSYDTQVSTFNYWVELHGEAQAVTFSARAGQSEHQLGTTLDFNIDEVAGREQHEWLAKNAQDFGFALSYPKGAQDITGYKYEPWHYRYIGVEAAKEWKAAGLPLCEFLKQKQ